ncbi:MAG: TerC family protein [Proteobacteria bacterium]|nr:TerC family protein [Pseudomonadota bacterium]
MDAFFSPEMLAFFKVIAIDLVLSGDNAVVIGLAVAGLPPELRKKAILFGIIAATVLRIIFAITTVWLLQITGILLIGGLLLAWVCWSMWKEIRHGPEDPVTAAAHADHKLGMRKALTNIIIADVSMSLDNVLAVAGAARDHLTIMIFGLVLSIALMAFAANFIATLLDRYRWIAYIGLAIIVWVAGDMIVRGGINVYSVLTSS